MSRGFQNINHATNLIGHKVSHLCFFSGLHVIKLFPLSYYDYIIYYETVYSLNNRYHPTCNLLNTQKLSN